MKYFTQIYIFCFSLIAIGANAETCSRDFIALSIDKRALSSWDYFMEHLRSDTRSIDSFMNGSRAKWSNGFRKRLMKANGHEYPFYFYKQGIAQRIRLLVKAESAPEVAIGNGFRSAGLESMQLESRVDDFAPEIKSWIKRAKEYQENLKSLVQTTQIIRKRRDLLQNELDLGGVYPKNIEIPQLKSLEGKSDEFEIELVNESFRDRASLERFIKNYEESNKDRFREIDTGARQEYWYMAGRHYEQALHRFQLEIFQKEFTKFSAKDSSPRLKALAKEVDDLLVNPDYMPPKDYNLGLLRQLYLSELGFYLGKARDMDDVGVDATLALRHNDRIDLGLNSATLSPSQRLIRYTYVTAPPAALSLFLWLWGDDAGDYVKGLWTGVRAEEGLIEDIVAIENDDAFMDQFSAALKARFDAEFDEEGKLKFDSEEEEKEGLSFVEKVRNSRIDYLERQDKRKETKTNFLKPQ